MDSDTRHTALFSMTLSDHQGHFSCSSLKTSMSTLRIVGPKCTLSASHAAFWWVTISMPTGQTDGRTDGRTLSRFPLNTASVIRVVLRIPVTVLRTKDVLLFWGVLFVVNRVQVRPIVNLKRWTLFTTLHHHCRWRYEKFTDSLSAVIQRRTGLLLFSNNLRYRAVYLRRSLADW